MKILTLKQIYERVKEEDLKRIMYELGFQYVNKYHYRTIYKFLKALKETPTTDCYYQYLKKKYKHIMFYSIYKYLKPLNWFSDFYKRKKLYIIFDNNTKKVLNVLHKLNELGYIDLKDP